MRSLLGKLARLFTPTYDLLDRDDDLWIAEGPDWWRLVRENTDDAQTPRTTRSEIELCHGPVVEVSHVREGDHR